ncbi:hypothetical protein F0562_019784 [Nyssa sinensis]|uniref:Uncharacterized protein n=1 Tax=Nyssa sinensis TaxID=561372 RepID=A0A5J5BQ42_9ASTE|nr:hypothetical protein F0562_019784 [Nyssa sinensis]
MDLETENRIAVILMKEAAELRKQAEKEGVHVYFQQRKDRGRPNSRFLTATVLGVQQANRAVEVNEMWRVRKKELELDDRLKGSRKEESSSGRSSRGISDSPRSKNKRHAGSERNDGASCQSSKRAIQDCYSREDDSLRDEEIEEFLHSRVKRGRGAVGSRMDETGPYLPPCTDSKGMPLEIRDVGIREDWKDLAVLGPEKPSSLKSCEYSEEESPHCRQNKPKKGSGTSSKQHSRKHRSKDKSRDKRKKKKRKDDKRRKHCK